MFRRSRRSFDLPETYAASLVAKLFYQCVSDAEIEVVLKKLSGTRDGQIELRQSINYLNDTTPKSMSTFYHSLESERLHLVLVSSNDRCRDEEHQSQVTKRQGERPDKNFLAKIAKKIEAVLTQANHERFAKGMAQL